MSGRPHHQFGLWAQNFTIFEKAHTFSPLSPFWNIRYCQSPDTERVCKQCNRETVIVTCSICDLPGLDSAANSSKRSAMAPILYKFRMGDSYRPQCGNRIARGRAPLIRFSIASRTWSYFSPECLSNVLSMYPRGRETLMYCNLTFDTQGEFLLAPWSGGRRALINLIHKSQTWLHPSRSIFDWGDHLTPPPPFPTNEGQESSPKGPNSRGCARLRLNVTRPSCILQLSLPLQAESLTLLLWKIY